NKGASPGIFNLKISKEPATDPYSFIEETKLLLSKATNLIKAEDKKLDMIMHPQATSGLLTYGFVPAVKGESFYKKSSRFQEKLGERVFSEKLSIYDDPRNDKAINYSLYDFDGIPTRRTIIVERGVLKNFMWNYYWAKLAGIESTGNGYRTPRTGEYDIRPFNLSIEPGKRSFEDIISDVDQGIYVMSFQGVHSTNPDSGMFSVMANPAFYIEEGEIKGCLLGAAITDNVDNVLSRVDEVSSDVMYNITFTLPWILVKNVRITSRL
ncbi:MAG TPA: TldD/PmbA family protein, partial [Bacteroidetes bacterium]|nr:TldD/PmbA family protein [Bacteroidota bacterium]